jgi:uncharacterized Zn finger protein
MQSTQAILVNASASIMMCPLCVPRRPMVIKSVATSLRGKSQTVTFECAQCGATLKTNEPVSPVDPAQSDFFKQDPTSR